MQKNLNKQLSKMISIISDRHAGQFDKVGNPYVLHPLKVMHYVKSDDIEIKIIALGHDLIEDTFKSVKDGVEFLRYHEFTDRIINGIVALTKIDGESYEDYKNRVKSNRDAIIVKMADLRHNSDIRRLKSKVITEKDIARTIKYHEFYVELEEVLSRWN